MTGPAVVRDLRADVADLSNALAHVRAAASALRTTPGLFDDLARHLDAVADTIITWRAKHAEQYRRRSAGEAR